MMLNCYIIGRNMRFVKYRTRWSHGYGQWEIEIISDYKYIRESGYKNTNEYLEDEVFYSIHKEWSYSEHYRGLEYNVITLKQLSKKDRLKLIKLYKQRIENYAHAVKHYTEIIKELENGGITSDVV